MKTSFKASLGFFASIILTFIVLSGHKVSAANLGAFTDCFLYNGETHIQGVAASSLPNVSDSQPFVHVTIQIFQNGALTPFYESLQDEPTNIREGSPAILTDKFEHVVLGKSLNQGTVYILTGLIRGTLDPPTPMGGTNVFFLGVIPDRCLMPPSAPPIGYFDSCALELGHTVIRGWAYDPDSTFSIDPRVTISIKQYPVASAFPIGGQTFTEKPLRTAEIHTFLNSRGYAFDPQVEFFGFEFIVPSGMTKLNTYLLSGKIQNIGGGPDGTIAFSADPPAGTNPFILSAIPQTCLPDKPPSTPTTPKPTGPGGPGGADKTNYSNSPKAVHQPINVPTTDLTGFGASGSVSKVLNLVLGLAGGVALLVIVVAGFRFVTSQGNPDATAKSRNTIIYALIGLVVCTLAYSIVTFVVERLS